MAFAVNLVAKGFQSARSGLIAIRDGILGVASAERRLAADTAHAAREQDKLAASARKAHQELKAAAAAFRAANEARGINPLTGGAATTARDTLLRGEAGTLASRRILLGSVGRQGLADQAALLEARRDRGGGGSEHLFGRLGGRIGRIFGEKGAKVGESVGGIIGGMAPVFGAIGLAAVGVSMAFDELRKQMERTKEEFVHIGEIRTEIRDAIIDAVKGANASAIGEARANKGAIASLINSGNIEQAQKDAQGLGQGGLQALGILNQKGIYNKTTAEAIRLMVATGQTDAVSAAGALGKYRGLSVGGSAEDLANGGLAQLGIYGVDAKRAGARFGASKIGVAYKNLSSADEALSGAEMRRFTAGGTEGVIREQAARVASPETAVRVEFQRKMDEQMSALKEALDNQNAFFKAMDGVINKGDSLRVTVLRTMRQNADAVNPDAPSP